MRNMHPRCCGCSRRLCYRGGSDRTDSLATVSTIVSFDGCCGRGNMGGVAGTGGNTDCVVNRQR